MDAPINVVNPLSFNLLCKVQSLTGWVFQQVDFLIDQEVESTENLLQLYNL